MSAVETIHPGGHADQDRLVRIKASAGSGKTFRLALRAIELLRAGEDPAELLATTFTRAAAGEIRDRIVGRLCAAAGDAAECAKLDADLRLTPRLAEAGTLDVATARRLVVRLAERIHRVQVRTLDSVFSAYVGAFATELGLPPAVRVHDEAEGRRLRRRAIEDVLDARGGDDDFDRLLRSLTQGRQDRGIEAALVQVVEDAHGAWRDGGGRSEPWRRIHVPDAPAEADVAAALEACRLALEVPKLTGRSTVSGLVIKFRDRRWSELVGMKAAASIFEDPPRLGNAKSIAPELVAALRTLVLHARHETLAEIAARSAALAAFCGLYDDALRRHTLDRGVLGFADLVQVLAEALGSEQRVLDDPEQVAYRLDGRIGHVLLDEFQDTSVAQWQVLRALIEPIVVDGTDQRTLFAVGDVKQAIYGWRGGSADLLQRLESALLPGTELDLGGDEMAESWRSAPEIMAAVNEVFGRLPANPRIDAPACVGAAAAWDAQWKEHVSAPPLATVAGYAELRSAGERQADEEAWGPQVRAVVDRVRHWRTQAPSASIAVLVATNAEGARIAAALRRDPDPIEPTLPGGRPLPADPVVASVLSLLHLADHPGDTAAWFHVTRTRLGAWLEVEPPPAEPGDAAATRTAARRLGHRVRRRLAVEGLDGLVRSILAAGLRDAATDGGGPAAGDDPAWRGLRRLAEAAEAWTGEHGHPLRTGPFLESVADLRVRDSEPGAVQIVTMHSAKGLEYDVVVLSVPNRHRGLAGRSHPLLVERDGLTGPVSLAMPWVSKKIRDVLFDASVADRFLAVEQASARESLCLLYVAMTRARRVLSMVTPPPEITAASMKEGETPKEVSMQNTVLGVLRGAFVPSGDIPAPGAVIARRGSEEDAATGLVAAAATESDSSEAAEATGTTTASSAAAPAPAGPTGTLRLAPARRPLVAAAAAASTVAEGGTPLAVRLRPSSDEPRARGTAIHGLFEQVTWIERFDLADADLDGVLRRTVAGRDAAWRMERIDEFRRMLADPPIADLLRLGDRDPTRVTVQPERRVARLGPDGVSTGIVDRLEIERDAGGRVTGLRIIDWKTDAAAPGAGGAPDAGEPDPAGAIARYRPQLAAYAAALAPLAAGAPIEATLVFTGAGRVVPVPIED